MVTVRDHATIIVPNGPSKEERPWLKTRLTHKPRTAVATTHSQAEEGTDL